MSKHQGNDGLGCSACGSDMDGQGMVFRGQTLCEDCFIDRVWPRVLPMHRPFSPAEFMVRLKQSFPARRQPLD